MRKVSSLAMSPSNFILKYFNGNHRGHPSCEETDGKVLRKAKRFAYNVY